MSSDRRRTLAALDEMIRRIDGIDRALEGRSLDDFASDLNTEAAVHHHILIIGEAARRIGDELEDLLPGFP